MLLGLATPAARARGIADAAGSPYQLAEFVGTHTNFDWALLWEALGVVGPNFSPLSERPCDTTPGGEPHCSVELINIREPAQVLVLLTDEEMWQVYLRYWRVGPTGWRFGGAYAPTVKYFRPNHEIRRFWNRPHLTITEQGTWGTGLATEVTTWLDLTKQPFEPTFSYMSRGHMASAQGSDFGREIFGVATTVPGSGERIEVTYEIRLSAYDGGTAGEIVIGRRTDTVASLKTDDLFHRDDSRSTITSGDFKAFYEPWWDASPTSDQLLAFDFEGLREIASRPDGPARRWLSEFLTRCSDTPQSRDLKALLAKMAPARKRSKR